MDKKLISKRRLIQSLTPRGLGELLRSSDNNIRSENITVLENMLGSVENLLNAVANNLQYKNITRREAGEISYSSLAGLTLSSGLITLLTNGCTSSTISAKPIDMSRPINPANIIHYPKLPGQKIQSPEHYGLEGCMTGVWSGGQQLKPTVSIYNYEKNIKKSPSIYLLQFSGNISSSIYYGLSQYLHYGMETCAEQNIIPFITYHLENNSRKEFNSIIKGKYDHKIKESAKELKIYGEEDGGFFIRTMREMNLSHAWPLWRGNPKRFKKIWKHIWNIFEQEGTNEYATWVLSPYASNNNFTSSYESFYPGEKYVDWIGINGYNYRGQANHSTQSFKSLFQYDYNKTRKKHPNKPIMIAATGTDEGRFKPNWVKRAFEDTKYEFPGIKALCWWNEKWSHNNINNYDSRINSSEKSLNAFKKSVGDKYFLGKVKLHHKH
ncbi:hypothetical protein HN415_08210 [Candidatus Woesearchaeota archaeon]|jgi:beta-mannanase|nr:hypothetical protein [Candidatus Woesearchaeota archaeon]